MIEIDKTLVTELIFEKRFHCDLEACKGACCVEGDSGAPLDLDEKLFLRNNIEKIKPFLREEGLKAIEEFGTSEIDFEGDEVTPLVNKKECAYTVFADNGIAQCGIENAYQAGAIDFIKPISCHLYPIRISKVGSYEAVNYSKWKICDPACNLGALKDLKVYQFLRAPLTRKYGEEYFEILEEVDKMLHE